MQLLHTYAGATRESGLLGVGLSLIGGGLPG